MIYTSGHRNSQEVQGWVIAKSSWMNISHQVHLGDLSCLRAAVLLLKKHSGGTLGSERVDLDKLNKNRILSAKENALKKEKKMHLKLESIHLRPRQQGPISIYIILKFPVCRD